tara:strand:+ start:1108 stop:1977 length:870 start_codon:yes stop_codon:yes gene_type:complete
MRKKYLISFASPDLKRSVHRFYEQTNNLNFYDHVKVFSIFDLDDKYQRYISNYLANRRNKKTGYGYWFWKPLIINNFLKKLKEDDILNYSDIGCHYNVNGTERLNYYVQRALDSDKGILAFQYNPLKEYNSKDFEFPNIKEYRYTKADLFKYFNVYENKDITHSNQFWSGNIFFKKNSFSLNFVQKWLEVFEKRFDLVEDTPSILDNHDDFDHHKHDQSVFSILCKIYNIEFLSAYECEWFYKNGIRFWKHTENNPILAKRDKRYSPFRRFLNRQIKTIRRYKSKFFNR